MAYKKIIYILLFFMTNIFIFANLPIPPLLEGSNLKLTMENGQLELDYGTTKTMGFNGDFLGPTIRVSNKDFVKFNIKNSLLEDSTVHWHGLHVPAKFDGGPHQIIKKNETWKPEFQIDQNAATLWYHPHLMGKTAEHVYNGLAGLFYIEDEYSKSLDIPKDYGVNDIPIILQDRRIDRDGKFSYNPGMRDTMMGYVGNIMLTNGKEKPTLSLKEGTYRFRLLNGSNSSIYQIRFSDDRNFTIIASDGGFLPKTVEDKSIIISPGERFEILIDINNGDDFKLITDIYGGESYDSLFITSISGKGEFYSHPKNFNYTPVSYNTKADKQRVFNMETNGMRGFSINGKRMDMNRIDFTLPTNSTEIWIIRNVGMGMMNVPHSFHVHDVQFTIISIDGKSPGPLMSGPKDTILLMPGQEIKIALNFQNYTGIYMYHCHFLEHEDQGMMGQFEVYKNN